MGVCFFLCVLCLFLVFLLFGCLVVCLFVCLFGVFFLMVLLFVSGGSFCFIFVLVRCVLRVCFWVVFCVLCLGFVGGLKVRKGRYLFFEHGRVLKYLVKMGHGRLWVGFGLCYLKRAKLRMVQTSKNILRYYKEQAV